MGACCSQSDKKMDKEISKSLLKQKPPGRRIVLFGNQGSGKTTILKQFDHIFSDGITIQNNRKKFNVINDIRQNCVDNILILCEMTNDEKTIKLLQNISINNNNNLQMISNIISNVWNRLDIKIKYEFRFFYSMDGYIIHDNMQHFFDKIEEIMNINYVPNTTDIIIHKTHTIVLDIILNHNRQWYGVTDIPFSLYSWKQLHCFEHFIFVFVASLTDFFDHNGLKTLKFYEELCNYYSVWSYKTQIIFLNKNDLFRKCLNQGMSLKYCFHDELPQYEDTRLPSIVPYFARNIDIIIPSPIIQLIQQYVTFIGMKSDQYYNESISFIKQQFKNRSDGQRELYCYVITAIDHNSVFTLFPNICSDVYLKASHLGGSF
eukprot:535747_1